MTALEARNICLGYKDQAIIDQLTLKIEKEKICTILGPNGSGKSTLLRSFSRHLKPKKGKVFLEGENLYSLSPREVARKVALLTQKPSAPGDLTVRDLIGYGRFPHRRWNGLQKEDHQIVDWALKQTSMEHLADRKLQELSGGEGQRAWLGMALAQRPQLLILDEPTTYLDIRHQLELMELVTEVNKSMGITILMVLHDLNQASKYSDRLIVLNKGKVFSDGSPKQVINKSMLREVFGIESEIRQDALTDKPVFDPIGLFGKNG